MTWKNSFYTRYGFPDNKYLSRLDSFRTNEQCFIRKDHNCGKIFGASKSCFIACPQNDELEPIIALMSEKLTKVGIEPIVAVKERAYGQDIFCTKICGKIIESRFCIVILDDSIEKEMKIPNPNVYYEYGLMTALEKHIIPLQKENLKLAFNIQSYDTIKYNSKNISSELDRAIKDAIRITEKKEKEGKEDKEVILPEKVLLRKLEMAGFNQQDDEWFLHNVIEDTNFKGFGQDNKDNKPFYLYLGKIDNTTEFQDYLSDLGIVIYRTEHKAKELQEALSSLKERLEDIKTDIERVKYNPIQNRPSFSLKASQDRETERINAGIAVAKNKLFLMSSIFVGFIINPQLDTDEFPHKAEELIQEYDRYKLSLNSKDSILFDDISVKLSVSST